MKIDVILPVFNHSGFTASLLDCIKANEVKPASIHLIDNGSTDDTGLLARRYVQLPIHYHRIGKNAGVNAAWNLGISLSESDLICFLNNDVVLPTCYFSATLKAFEALETMGIVVPFPADNPDSAKVANCSGCGRLSALEKRMGWAFTIKRDLVLDIGPVPFQVRNFFGDDWFFDGAWDRGMQVAQLNDVPAFHHGSVTLKSTGLIHTLREERNSWATRR